MNLPPLRVIEVTAYRILLEEETGTPNGRLFEIVAEEHDGMAVIPTLVINELKPKEIR